MKRLLKDTKGSVMVEFSVCGILFIGFVMGIIVLGIWIYNVSQVTQAARLAAHNMAATNNAYESQEMALNYLKKTLIACPTKGATASGNGVNGHGVAEAYMDPLFPGFELLLDPGGTPRIGGAIHIRREATRVSEYRFRPKRH